MMHLTFAWKFGDHGVLVRLGVDSHVDLSLGDVEALSTISAAVALAGAGEPIEELRDLLGLRPADGFMTILELVQISRPRFPGLLITGFTQLEDNESKLLVGMG